MNEYRDKLASITIMKPSSSGQMEKRWERDMPAYRRMRRQGLQPKTIDGCAELEAHATERFEVEMGHLFPTPEEKAEAKAGMEMARELELGEL